ncbi:MAG: TRAP transporter small permease [Alphaproteobacteria bacterium]|nr:TRAP transporter small permease [Alphaproteobacteria bacterium]
MNESDRPEETTPSGPRRGSWLIAFPEGASALVLFALMAMTCIDVIGRELFGTPLDGATELTQLMLGVIVFAILPSVCLREEHVSVDLLDLWYPERLVPLRQAVLNAVMAVALGFVAWRVWIIAGLTADYGDATEFLEIRLAPINYFIAALSACGAAAFVANTVRHARAALSAPAAKDAPDDRGTA